MSRNVGLGAAATTIAVAIVLFALGSGFMSRDASAKGIKLQAQGDRIEVRDESSDAVLHTIAKPPGVTREMFALDGGNVIVTTRKDESDLWDAATGRKLRTIPERVYAFSHAQTSFVGFTPERNLVLRGWPDRSVKLILDFRVQGGPASLAFSPDDRFLAVQYCNVYPLSDAQFLNPSMLKTLYWVKLFDLGTGKAVKELGDSMDLGSFSEDGRSYVVNGRPFDLATRKFRNAR